MRARVYDHTNAQLLGRDPLVGFTRQPYTYALDSAIVGGSAIARESPIADVEVTIGCE